MDVLFQWYGRIDATWYVTPATQLLSNPQPCFVGTAPSTGRPGWSNKGYSPGRHARALVKALADSLLGFWPRCPLSVGLSREHLFGLESTWLGSAPNTWLSFWSACPPSVCPAPECLSGLCFEILDRGRHVPAPSGRDVGSNARAPTRETVQGTDPRNGFLLCRYPHGVLRRSLRRVVRCQPAHGGYDVLGGTSPCSRCPSLVWRHCLRGGKVRTGFSSVLGREIKGCSGTVNFDPLCGFWGSFCNEQIQRQLTEPPRVPSLQCMVFWLHFFQHASRGGAGSDSSGI